MRSDRDERGERGKKKISVRFPDTLPLGPQPAERFTRGAMRWYWTSFLTSAGGGGATAVRQEADEHRAVHQRGPVPSHGTASEPLSWLRTERQCVREPDRDFIFSSLPSLVSAGLF